MAIPLPSGWTGQVAIMNGAHRRGLSHCIQNRIASLQDGINRLLCRLHDVIRREPLGNLLREWMLEFAGGVKFVAEKPTHFYRLPHEVL